MSFRLHADDKLQRKAANSADEASSASATDLASSSGDFIPGGNNELQSDPTNDSWGNSGRVT